MRAKFGRVWAEFRRVLGVTAWAETLAVARLQAYHAVKEIRFDGKIPVFRRDIGGPILELN
ncbi:hypothetical protein A3I40_02615 [Candidatus Uhrbacteria bacterium RIFCSPLOWO2_02_FULL_48_12]|uniref:Phosphoribosylglycinamide synthetase C-domain domain-containing protein n=1 Tax=Candidatus Uhrbacteria bacterium RIFCSPLOWO2_02_FULL_48_12 TaxID=1802407 RepID=A0A1F7VAG0_9BACT|nr:MAG: hypothetical protein A3I40_02615 [Candidatus Uhrbacteria bacterium RIFCSPLOWO2_02_FULL_48_12]